MQILLGQMLAPMKAEMLVQMRVLTLVLEKEMTWGRLLAEMSVMQ